MITALDELIAKVEAGEDTDNHHAAVFPSESAYGHCKWHDSHKAARGSLDAALALHKAVLPPKYILAGVHEFMSQWGARIIPGDHIGNHPDNPARAWLLAILRAMQEGRQ